MFGLLSSAVQAEPWTLDQTLTEAQRYSAELSASRNEAQALDAMADSATQLPDPKLKFGIENVPVQGNNDRRLTREGMTMQKLASCRAMSVPKNANVKRKPSRHRREVCWPKERLFAQRFSVIPPGLARTGVNATGAEKAKALVSETGRRRGVQKASVGAGGSTPDSVLALQMTLSAMRDKETLRSVMCNWRKAACFS
jgi:hypothetical protein